MSPALDLPDFVVIGTQRAGTTWLYEQLKIHPDVFLPYVKELHFFDRNWDRGLDWYRQWFAGRNDEHVAGEITPHYIQQPEAPSRMASVLPDTRVILVLRNPIDFLVSLHRLHIRSGITNEDFDSRCRDAGFIGWARMSEKLEQWSAHFPAERLLVLLYDDLLADRSAFLGRIYHFIGVDPPSSDAQLEQRVNPTFKPRFPFVHRVLHQAAKTIRNRQWSWMNRVLAAIRPLFNRGFYLREISVSDKLTVDQRTMLASLFADDVARLSELLDRDLATMWNIPKPEN